MIEREELLALIPHRNSMMLLSRVINYDLKEKNIEAEYDISQDCIFYDQQKKGVPSWVGFEFIAQAISAYIGIKCRENNLPVNEGFILSVSHMHLDIPFFKNKGIITIKSRELDNVDAMYIFNGEILQDGKEVISARLTVMEVMEKEK